MLKGWLDYLVIIYIVHIAQYGPVVCEIKAWMMNAHMLWFSLSRAYFFPFFIASFLGEEGVEGDVRIIVSLENLKIASQNALRTLQWGKEMHGGYKSSISINF